MKRRRRLKIIIITHSFSPGTAQALYKYCINKKYHTRFISHPLFGNIFTWSFDAIKTILQVIVSGRTYHFYIGSNRLNAFIGILLKRLRRVKKVIYFSPDWSVKRFDNRALNFIFKHLDYYCVKHSDMVWNSSTVMKLDPMMKARERLGYPKSWRKKQIQVPDGTDTYPYIELQSVNRYEVGFVGHLRESVGVQTIVDAYPHIVKVIPKIKITVIGSGPLKKELIKRAHGYNIEFTGFIGDIGVVYKKLSKCALAIAPYKDIANNISRYTDPGKVKNYLSVSLPVVITAVPAIARELNDKHAGIIVKDDPMSTAQGIVTLLKNDRLLSRYRYNAWKLAKKYSWNNIFNRAIKHTVSTIGWRQS